MVSNEQLILLYKETMDSKNKNLLFNKLFGNLEKGAMKVCHYYCKLLPAFYQEDFFEESIQEARLCLLKCINAFIPSNGTKFITFYFKGLSNHICNYFSDKIKRINSELSNNPLIEWKDFGYDSQIEENIDRIILRDILDDLIDKINFSKNIHKSIFLDYIGFNEEKNTDENFCSLSKKYNLTRMAIGKICNKYLDIARNILKREQKLESIKSFSGE